jgi:hypothetical protein
VATALHFKMNRRGARRRRAPYLSAGGAFLAGSAFLAGGACALMLALAVAGPSAMAQGPAAPAQTTPAQTPAPGANPATGATGANPATPTPEQPPAPGGAAGAGSAFRPGFIDALGRWLEDSAGKLKSGAQEAQEKLDRLNNQARDIAKDMAKDATGVVTTLPSARPRTGHERCLPAPNGAPDCQTAAVALCRGGGFAGGKILDTASEQKCSARPFLEGRAPTNADCPTELFVTRAMCQ